MCLSLSLSLSLSALFLSVRISLFVSFCFFICVFLHVFLFIHFFVFLFLFHFKLSSSFFISLLLCLPRSPSLSLYLCLFSVSALSISLPLPFPSLLPLCFFLSIFTFFSLFLLLFCLSNKVIDPSRSFSSSSSSFTTRSSRLFRSVHGGFSVSSPSSLRRIEVLWRENAERLISQWRPAIVLEAWGISSEAPLRPRFGFSYLCCLFLEMRESQDILFFFFVFSLRGDTCLCLLCLVGFFGNKRASNEEFKKRRTQLSFVVVVFIQRTVGKWTVFSQSENHPFGWSYLCSGGPRQCAKHLDVQVRRALKDADLGTFEEDSARTVLEVFCC